MIRAIGAALAMLGSTGIGLRAYLALSARVRELAGYSSMLEILRCEIELRLTPIDRALETARSTGAARPFVDRVLDGVRRRGCAEIAEVWSDAASVESREIRSVLAELSPVLGRYGAAEQGRALADARRRMDMLREQAESDLHRSGKLYMIFGICGGIAVTVLFI